MFLVLSEAADQFKNESAKATMLAALQIGVIAEDQKKTSFVPGALECGEHRRFGFCSLSQKQKETAKAAILAALQIGVATSSEAIIECGVGVPF